MLEHTNIWTTGPMDLYVNNKPAKVYIPETNVQEAYNNLSSRLSNDGKIPIGIDHLSEDIIKANGILAKMNLLDVGYITEIEYANDTINIVDAELTNPIIKQLYDDGELDMVSIVGNSKTSKCPKDNYDYVINSTDIVRVDIVEKGACPTCNIPKPQQNNDSEVVYARYSIKEDTIMAEEITMEAIQEAIAAAVEEAIAPINERLDVIEKEIADSADTEPANEEEESEVEAMKARIKVLEEKATKDAEDAKVEAASAKVDLAIQAGKIKPADRENMIIMAKNSTDAFDEYIKNADVIVPIGARQSVPAGEEPSEPELDEDDKLIAEMESAFDRGE